MDNKIKENIDNQEGIATYSKVIEERAFFEFNKKTHIAYIKGVDINYTNVNSIDTTVYIGSWLNEEIPYGAVVGNGISSILSIVILSK